MTTADKVTSVRLVLAPIFFIIYFLSDWFPSLGVRWSVPVLWLLFIVAELTDMVDGQIARSRKQVSDFGKLYDPFADTLARITYFLCFVVDGVLPAVLLVVVLFREFGILFLRILMMQRGIAMGARSGGKIKAVAYMLTGVAALAAASSARLGFDLSIFQMIRYAAVGLFVVAVILSLASFIDYFRVFRKSEKV
jgi:CDP-diacylglycerol--glycerol-3-phosphate 3-phosphatidyltransferase